MKFFKTLVFAVLLTFLTACGARHSEIVRYSYCPDPVPVPDCVKFGDISSICFQKWMEAQEKLNQKLAEGQKWRWSQMGK